MASLTFTSTIEVTLVPFDIVTEYFSCLQCQMTDDNLTYFSVKQDSGIGLAFKGIGY